MKIKNSTITGYSEVFRGGVLLNCVPRVKDKERTSDRKRNDNTDIRHRMSSRNTRR